MGRAKKTIMGSIDPSKLINYENIGMIVFTLFIIEHKRRIRVSGFNFILFM